LCQKVGAQPEQQHRLLADCYGLGNADVNPRGANDAPALRGRYHNVHATVCQPSATLRQASRWWTAELIATCGARVKISDQAAETHCNLC